MKILALLLLLGWSVSVQAAVFITTSTTTTTKTATTTSTKVTTSTSISISVIHSTSTVLIYSTIPACASTSTGPSVSSSSSKSISATSTSSSSVSTSSGSSSKSISATSTSSSSVSTSSGSSSKSVSSSSLTSSSTISSSSSGSSSKSVSSSSLTSSSTITSSSLSSSSASITSSSSSSPSSSSGSITSSVSSSSLSSSSGSITSSASSSSLSSSSASITSSVSSSSLSSSSTSITSSSSRSSVSSTTSSSSDPVSPSSSSVSSSVSSYSSSSSTRVSSSSSTTSSSAAASSSCSLVPLNVACGPGTTETVLNGQYNECELGLPSFSSTPGISAFTPAVITGYCLNDCVTAGGFAATTDANGVCLCYSVNVCAYGGTDITIPAVQPGAAYSLTFVLANNPVAPGCCSGSSSPNSVWQPAVGTPWQIVLYDVVNPDGIVPDVPIYDIDLFNTPNSTIASLHAQGKKVICYFSAGSIDNFRPDYDEFQPADFGNAISGWPGQWYADITHQNVWNINQARIELAAQKGCDAIDPDNMDGYNNDNGLGLTAQDSINYFTFLAQQANGLGLAIGLKNALGIFPDVGNLAQFAVNEICLTYDECGDYDSFLATKPVFHIEYTGSIDGTSKKAKRDSLTSQFCPTTSPLTQMSTVIKTLDLDGIVEYCDGTVYNTPATD